MCAYFPEHLDVILYDFIGVSLIHDLTQGPGNTTCYTKEISFGRFFQNLPCPAPGSDSNRLVSPVDIRRFADNERVEAGSAGG